jgi:hypothetical protein
MKMVRHLPDDGSGGFLMASNEKKEKRLEYTAKLILILVFLGALLGFIGYMTFWGPGLSAFKLSWLDLVLLAFSTYRMGHLISYDRVMEPLRQFFTETVPDSTGAGESVEAKGVGFQQAIGQLVCCPICSGTWVAAMLVYLLYLWPDATRVFLAMTAAVGAAELLNNAGEAFSWSGQYYRTVSGAQMASRRKNVVLIEQPCDDVIPEKEEIRAKTDKVRKLE